MRLHNRREKRKMKKLSLNNLYKNRFLSEGHPAIESRGPDTFIERTRSYKDANIRPRTVKYFLEKLLNLSKGSRTALVVGCGPTPRLIKELLDSGYDAIGVDAIPQFVEAAVEFLGDSFRCYLGCAESLPIEDNSKRIVVMEALLEHVDSPRLVLSEAHRVLEPGGVLYISTTNRLWLRQKEYRTLFFQWFPDLVKESYAFKHLHYDPRIGNFFPRPAVHWFTYADLCKIGRSAGFAHFYSPLDLMDADVPWLENKGSLARLMFKHILKPETLGNHPWLRSLALTQAGGHIFMLKR